MNAIVRRAKIAALCLVAGLGAPGAAVAACEPASVSFARGAFATELAGGVALGERDCFTIGAAAGQRLSVTQAPGQGRNIVFQLYKPGWRIDRSPDGTDVSGDTLRGAGQGDDARRWSGRLPLQGDYLLVIGTTRGSGEYRIRVAVR